MCSLFDVRKKFLLLLTLLLIRLGARHLDSSNAHLILMTSRLILRP